MKKIPLTDKELRKLIEKSTKDIINMKQSYVKYLADLAAAGHKIQFGIKLNVSHFDKVPDGFGKIHDDLNKQLKSDKSFINKMKKMKKKALKDAKHKVKRMFDNKLNPSSLSYYGDSEEIIDRIKEVTENLKMLKERIKTSLIDNKLEEKDIRSLWRFGTKNIEEYLQEAKKILTDKLVEEGVTEEEILEILLSLGLGV